MQQAISTRFDTDTILRLDEVATNQERSRSDIVKEAVAYYLDHVAWYGEEIEKGRADVAAGRIVDSAHVKDRILELGLDVD